MLHCSLYWRLRIKSLPFRLTWASAWEYLPKCIFTTYFVSLYGCLLSRQTSEWLSEPFKAFEINLDYVLTSLHIEDSYIIIIRQYSIFWWLSGLPEIPLKSLWFQILQNVVSVGSQVFRFRVVVNCIFYKLH